MKPGTFSSPRPSAKAGLFALLLFISIIGLRLANGPAQARGGKETVAIHFEQFSSGFTVVSSMEFGDDGRLYVADILGRIYIVETDGTVNPTPFLDLSEQVGNNGKQALSSFVFHPDFENNGIFYVNYTSPDDITYLSRFHVMAADPNQGDPDSEAIMMAFQQPSTAHNGAGMQFGPDGYLYVGMGDGGYYDDPDNNGQNGQTLLGAILRIDVNGAFPYEIPPDNPFVGNPAVLDEIWAMGLRNPWRFDFDALTDDLYIADVGGTFWEEINFEAAGSGGGFNYGWRCYQGFAPHITTGCQPPDAYTFPVYVRTHNTMCAIIGGYVYRGSQYPMLDGHFLFSDYCSGRTRGLLRQPDGSFTIASTGKINGGEVTTFGQDPNGELYIASNHNIYKITAETVTLTPQIYLPTIHHNN